MIITRETDYALRILRALRDGEQRTIGQICQSELLPQPFAYKILKKLSTAGLIEATRGLGGGCRLAVNLADVSLYQLMMATGESSGLSSCMDEHFQCPWRECHGGCAVHCNLMKIQRQLDEQLKQHSLQDILTPQ